MFDQTKIITGVDPFSDRLCVLPESEVAADLALVETFGKATCLGDLKRHPVAWDRTVAFPIYDESGDEVDVEVLPDATPFEFGEWFGEEAFAQLPLARLRTAELCPGEVMQEFGRPDHEVGFVDYEPAPWLSADDRDAIERRLVSLGFEVKQEDELLGRYLDA